MRSAKPLGQKCYGSIGHLPGSRRGPADRGVNDGQARIATERARDNHDTIVVQEKLDGSNVAIANIDGEIVPLIRAGYHAREARREQHRHFANWVSVRERWFDFLEPGERLAGEWLLLAHGTRYEIRCPHALFVSFDIMRNGHERATWEEFSTRVDDSPVLAARTIHVGGPLSIEDALRKLGPRGYHGALDDVEGAVWRVERGGRVDFLAKYVRPGKTDGLYFEDGATWTAPVWNWPPGVEVAE